MSTTGLLWRQFRFERRMFWRNPSAAFFNFMLPLIFLFLIASVFGHKTKDLNTLVPGIAGMAVMTTTFTALAFNIAFLREQGILKRIRGTPMPPIAYFGGILANAVTNAVVQVALVVGVGHFVYGLGWPRDWFELAAFVLVGVVAFGSLGVAFAHAIPNFDAAPAYVNAVFLPLIFISGTFYSSSGLPKVLEVMAKALPLKHVIDGLRAAIVQGSGLSHHLGALGALAAWAVGGTVLAVRFFRWE
ncbi:MAG: type transport system permease protein [Thermoleophilaceae bacterium]|nr:type transport system permease protein [Thermoleophilaceae bacterium]MEA2353471.1 type transport system permease protein [Thermoleophilaceae bacterium]